MLRLLNEGLVMEMNIESTIANQVQRQHPSWELLDLPKADPVAAPCENYVGDFRVDRAAAHRSELFTVGADC